MQLLQQERLAPRDWEAHVTVSHSPVPVRPDLAGVFRQHYSFVVNVASRVLGSTAEAEDVAQEVFVAFGRTDVPEAEARGWLSVAAVHSALNVLRSGIRRSAREERVHDPHHHSPDVADLVITLDERRRVREGLARLPAKQAEALVLRHSGMSYADIASALDLSPNSVGTTIRRAESSLRKELSK